MEFRRLLEIVGDEPVFETGLLLAGPVQPADVRRQLSRWTKSGKLHQLRRGLYALAQPFQKAQAHPFLVANRLVRASYVSLQSVLAHYDLIPEYVPVTTSITTRRPARWDTPFGRYDFRHVQVDFWRGYKLLDLGGGQQAFVATPEKALLDLIYLTPDADNPAYLRELRLQNLDRLNLDELRRQAALFPGAKLRRAVEIVAQLARDEAEEYETL